MSKVTRILNSLLSFVKNPWDRHRKLTKVALLIGQPIVVGSLLVTGLVWSAQQKGWLQLPEMIAFDYIVRLQHKDYRDDRLLVVRIDEIDIQNQDVWPISDQVLAQLLEQLQQHQPRVIGLDLYRERPYPPGSERLALQLQESNVIVIENLVVDNETGVGPPPNIPSDRISFNDTVLDPDGVIRRQFMFTGYQGGKYSFALRVVLDYLNLSVQPKPDVLYIGSKSFPRLPPDAGGYQSAETHGYQVLLNYGSSKAISPEVSLTEVLQGKLTSDQVKDKIVLIGTTAASEKDVFRTPYTLTKSKALGTPGVIIHGQAISHLLRVIEGDEPLFWFWSQQLEGWWMWGWALVGGIFAWRLKHPASLGIISFLGLGGLFGSSYLAFRFFGWIPLISPALTFIFTGGSITVYKVFYNAFHDSLTGLPNRSLFTRQLQWEITPKKGKNTNFSVLCLGLDQFKVINETAGQSGGDEMLKTTVRRLKRCLRPTDQLARVGGDEFAIFLKYKGDEETVIKIAKRLQKELKHPFHLNGQDIFTTVSIGISLYQQESEHEPIELLQNAHTAMDRAKTLGKDRYELFATGMRTQVVSRFQLERDLREAIKKQEFILYYQPIIDLKTGKIAGFEALVRWQHPERGFVSPGAFIPVTEETGLIIPLGQWILHEACHQMRLLHEEFPSDHSLMISVNLSSKQFAQPDLVEQVENILQQTQLNPNSLKLEVTESMVIDDVEEAIALLNRLKSLGIRLSIDDFGTGYSSLSYLHRFPMDTLKVDRSFVSRMEETGDENAIVRTIVVLGHNLEMDVIAEGVETAEQLSKLRSLHCEYGQGYFFAKPLPIDEMKELLLKDPQW